MSILQVGATSLYKRISDAVAAARDGDIVEVAAGTYLNDFTQVNAKITLRGVGGMVHMVATEAPRDGKAIMTVSNDLVLERFSFTGAKVPDRNGAGIRYQGGNLVVRDSVFVANQNGILAGGVADGTILIERSEFSGNGEGTGNTHNLYVGIIKDLTIRDSYFHDAVVGHEIKSRALNTTITGTRILNNSGNASYSVDLPNGGVALLQNNVIQKGVNAPNQAILHFGGEGPPHAGSQLTVVNNTIVNDRATVVGLSNVTGTTAVVTGNSLFGVTAASLGGKADSNPTLAARPVLDLSTQIVTPPAPPPPVVLTKPVPDGAAYLTFGRDGAVQANGTVLQVGRDKAFKTLEQALAASRDGDTVQVDAGTYTNDFSVVTRRVIIEGVGGMAKFVATRESENSRGTLVARADMTVRNLEFTGNLGSSGNAAGIRHEAGHLTVVNSNFHGNDVSILATAGYAATLSIFDTEIGANGSWGKGTHNINVRDIGSFTLEDSYVWGGSYTGHEVNSTALFTRITDSRIIQSDNANPSFAINLGYGGDAVIRDTVVVKGAKSENGVLIHAGGEGPMYANSNVQVIDSTLVTNFANVWRPWSYFLIGDAGKFGGAPPVSAQNVTFVGGAKGSIHVIGGVNTGASYQASVVLDTSAPWSPPVAVPASALAVGPNTLTLRMAGVQSLYAKVDMQFIVRVDGQPVGGGTVNAVNGRDPYQAFTFTGQWGAGAHAIEIEAVNVRGTSLSAHRLFVNTINLDGNEIKGHGLVPTGQGDLNSYVNVLRTSLQGRDMAAKVEPPAPAVVLAAEPPARVLTDFRESRSVPSVAEAGVRGAEASPVSGTPTPDVFDLTTAGPAPLADVPATPPVPLAWTALTGMELFSRAFDLVRASRPISASAAPDMLAGPVPLQAYAAAVTPVQPDAVSYLLPS